jgi:hypothetical protein
MGGSECCTDLKIKVLKIRMVDGVIFFSFKQIGCVVNPCLPIPYVPYGFGTHSVLCSEQDAVADFLAKQIWS